MTRLAAELAGGTALPDVDGRVVYGGETAQVRSGIAGRPWRAIAERAS